MSAARTLTEEQIHELLVGIGPLPVLQDFAAWFDRSIHWRNRITKATVAASIKAWTTRQSLQRTDAALEELEHFEASEAVASMPYGMAFSQALQLNFDPWTVELEHQALANLLSTELEAQRVRLSHAKDVA
jgi:hypothetical protein